MRMSFAGCRAAFLLALCVCVTVADASAAPARQPVERLPYARVFVMNPYIIFEDARNEQDLQSVDPAAQLAFDELSPQWADGVFSNVGMQVVSPSSLAQEQAAAVKGSTELLDKNVEDLVKQWKDKASFMPAFQAIAGACGADCLLVQFVKVKVGERGSWDFMVTGAVTPTTSSTSVKAVLIDLKTGAIGWSGSAIEHAMPDKSVVKRLYGSLYGTFPGYDKKGGRR